MRYFISTSVNPHSNLSKKVLEAEDKSDIYIMMAGLDEYLLFLEEITEEEKDKIDKYYEIKKA
ncbi:MAG TPA: hypothetical protein DC024_05245 [Clostridiales bacterium]|jgi:hypothetical protein|uniref:hypothetical protein n=1 Tax=Proteiniphilum sp. UBA5375 TaxID=1947278 RepID=UPI000E906B43|nr:hypothetical protein [Proteiniphilum sp. UBA5375]HBC30639.1 hypothetical protein [Clostridiales bacterium]